MTIIVMIIMVMIMIMMTRMNDSFKWPILCFHFSCLFCTDHCLHSVYICWHMSFFFLLSCVIFAKTSAAISYCCKSAQHLRINTLFWFWVSLWVSVIKSFLQPPAAESRQFAILNQILRETVWKWNWTTLCKHQSQRISTTINSIITSEDTK